MRTTNLRQIVVIYLALILSGAITGLGTIRSNGLPKVCPPRVITVGAFGVK